MTKKDIYIRLKAMYDSLIFLEDLKCAATRCKCDTDDETADCDKKTLAGGVKEIFDMTVDLIDDDLLLRLLKTNVFEKYAEMNEVIINLEIDKLNKELKP